MIECIKDDKGNIQAVIEWQLLDKHGSWDDKGNILFIEQLEVNPEVRHKGIIKRFVKVLYAKCPTAEAVFWYREYKYPNRKPSIYSVNKFIKRS